MDGEEKWLLKNTKNINEYKCLKTISIMFNCFCLINIYYKKKNLVELILCSKNNYFLCLYIYIEKVE